MANRKAAFRQTDVARAIRGALAGGLAVTKTRIAPDGSIEVFHDTPRESDNLTPFQKWKAEQDARATERDK